MFNEKVNDYLKKLKVSDRELFIEYIAAEVENGCLTLKDAKTLTVRYAAAILEDIKFMRSYYGN